MDYKFNSEIVEWTDVPRDRHKPSIIWQKINHNSEIRIDTVSLLESITSLQASTPTLRSASKWFYTYVT